MRRRSVSCGEAFPWHDESCGIWSEVEEELGDNVKSKECTSRKFVVCEAHDAEDDGENDEATNLDGFATNGIDESNSNPVSWNSTGADDDQVTDGDVVQDMVDVGSSSIADLLQDDGVVEGDTIERHI